MDNKLFPVVSRLIEDDSLPQSIHWIAANGNVFYDCFTDSGANSVPNAVARDWIRDGFDMQYALHKPLAYADNLRDVEYPMIIGRQLGIEDPRCFYSNSGSEAIEVAIKLARKVTDREYVAGIDGDFHGRTLATLNLHRRILTQGLPPYHFDGFGIGDPDCFALAQADLTDNIVQPTLPHLAALVISPVCTNNTIALQPDWVWKLAEQVRKNGGLIIFDEIQTGFGRGGGMVSIVETDWWIEYGGAVSARLYPDDSDAQRELENCIYTPDIYVFGKGMAAGYPMSLTVARASLVDTTMTLGTHFNTMAGSPLGAYLSVRYLGALADGMLDDALEWAEQLEAALTPALVRYGYLMGLRSDDPIALAQALRDNGILCAAYRPAPALLRFAPALWMRSNERVAVQHLLTRVLATMTTIELTLR